jgi:hypothetical protein
MDWISSQLQTSQFLTILKVRSPQGQVVSEKLHDQGGILVALFRQSVKFSNSIIESLLGQVAGTVGGVENLVVEDGEVESKSKTDGVSWGQFGLCDFCGALVGFMSTGSSLLARIASSKLCKITVIISLPASKNLSDYYHSGQIPKQS